MDDHGYADVPYLADAARDLATNEREQLAAIIRRWEPSLATDKMALAVRYPSMPGPLHAIAECPIEWWDVLDDGALRYRIWLFAADSGLVFEGDTTKLVPGEQINRGAYYGDGWEGTKPGSLAEQFEHAQRAVKSSHPTSELAHVAFVDRSSPPKPAKPVPAKKK